MERIRDAGGTTVAADVLYLRFCRVAALAFFLVVAYTLAAKLPAGRLAGDWMHSALHVVTGAVAVALGWFHHGSVGPRVFTAAIVAGYGLLGTIGWFIRGIAVHTVLAIPLAPADNVFHLLLSAIGLTFIVLARRAA